VFCYKGQHAGLLNYICIIKSNLQTRHAIYALLLHLRRLDQICQPQNMLRTKSEIQLNIFCRRTHFLFLSIFFDKFSNLGKSKNARRSFYWILQAFSGVINTCIKSTTFNIRFCQFYARPLIKLNKLLLLLLWLIIYIYVYMVFVNTSGHVSS